MTTSTIELDKAQTQQYASNVAMLAQQKMSRLRPFVEVASYTGSAAQVKHQLGTVEMLEVAVTGGDNQYGSPPVDSPWVFPSAFTRTLPIDKVDDLRTIADFSNPFVAAAVLAGNRKIDDVLIAAAFADAKRGKNAASTVSFPAAQQVSASEGAGSAVGMNVAKMLKGLEILGASEAIEDDEEIYLALTTKQITDLKREVQFVNGDYRQSSKPLDGRLVPDSFGQIRFVRTERLLLNGSSQRRCIMWTRRGLHLGVWDDINAEVAKNPAKQNNWECTAKLMCGATRTEDALVVEIPCA